MSIMGKRPFYNVGYCKNKDKCSNEHTHFDCPDKECQNKKCNKRHQRQCRFEERCSFLRQNKCEYKHGTVNGTTTKQIDEINSETNKLKKETTTLKGEIVNLKKTIEDQNLN